MFMNMYHKKRDTCTYTLVYFILLYFRLNCFSGMHIRTCVQVAKPLIPPGLFWNVANYEVVPYGVGSYVNYITLKIFLSSFSLVIFSCCPYFSIFSVDVSLCLHPWHPVIHKHLSHPACLTSSIPRLLKDLRS